MPQSPDKDLLKTALKLAKEFGADAAEAVYYEEAGLNVGVRLGRLETLERPASQSIGLRVFVGQKSTSLSTHDLRATSIREMAEKAVQIASISPETPLVRLPETYADEKSCSVDLEIYDPKIPDADELKTLALETEAVGLNTKGITNSEGASAGWRSAKRTHVTSNGFEGTAKGSEFSFYTVFLGGEGKAMERDYDFSSARFFSDLEDAKTIGRKAAERTLKRLNPRKIKTQEIPVIYHNRAASSLLRHFANAVNGKAVAKGTTFLAKKMGDAIFPKTLEIVDDPTRKRGLGSNTFDGEGQAMKNLNLVEAGVLKSWLLDGPSAREMNLKTNGRSYRSLAGSTTPAPTNLYIKTGTRSLKDMMGEAKTGLLITELIGMGVNGVTGDYSRGASGFWFENGEIAFPVSEITVAGNLINMFADMIPADDLIFKQRINSPSLLIPKMTVAGS